MRGTMTAVSADVAKLTKRENISDMDGSLPADGAFNYESFLSTDILSALDFPMEDIDDSVEDNDWDTKFQDIEPPPNIDQLLGPGIFSYDDEKKHTNLSTPYGHMYQRPQFPSVTCETIRSRVSLRKDDLESIGSCAAQFEPKFEKRTRSKLSRSRRANPIIFSTQFILSTSSNSSASENLHRWDDCEFDLEASRTEDTSNTAKRKHKKKTGKLSDEAGESRESKRCAHCQVTKTPQWREGPLGPKTLCNACGVRYRSGRLLPEYRPAASPTFIASVHSNSHKKVIELRSKSCQGASMGILSSGQ